MYPEERQHALALLVGQRGRLSVTTAAEQFGVTTETVRRDLAVLERAGMLRRVHGGAVPVSAVALVELGLGERTGHLSEQKAKIASAALDFVPGMDGSIILDGGTTTAALASCSRPTGACSWSPTRSPSRPGWPMRRASRCTCSAGGCAA